HQPRELHLHRVGGDPGDRRAGRHGQPDRRRPGGHPADRRAGVLPRARGVPHACLRRRHGRHHDLASARPAGPPRADRPPRRTRHDGRAAVSAAVNQVAATAGLGTAPALLTVEHLTMRFGGLLAIDDVSFAAGDAEITSIIGPNGAGKTTMFNCLTGFYKPTVGRLTLAARHGDFLLEQMEGFRISQKARVARTFQNIRLFPGMSVLENLIVAQHNKLMRASAFTLAGLVGLPRYNRAERQAVELARYWLDKVNLTALADTPAGSLPYGSQRRLEIVRAMCNEPVLLCLDEPAAGLNARESAELNTLLLAIKREQQIAILLIEHDMGVVMGISDHIVVLDYGRKIADGTPEEIRNDPAVIKAYLGEEEDEELPPEIARDLAIDER